MQSTDDSSTPDNGFQPPAPDPPLSWKQMSLALAEAEIRENSYYAINDCDTTRARLKEAYDDPQERLRIQMLIRDVVPYLPMKEFWAGIGIPDAPSNGAPIRTPPPQDGRAEVRDGDGHAQARAVIPVVDQLSAMVDQTIDALHAQGEACRLFVHSGRLVHVADRQVMPVRPHFLLCECSRAATYTKWDGREKAMKPVEPQLKWATAILEQDEWPAFRQMRGLSMLPILRQDGSLCDTPGYDAVSQRYYLPPTDGTTFPPLPPDAISLAHAKQLANDLYEPFEDFLFLDPPQGLSAVYAALLTCLCRHLIDGPIPLFGVSASIAGSGKGKLIDVIGMIATGEEPAVMPQQANPEEDQKRILSILSRGRLVAHIDNCTTRIGGGALESLLTARQWYEDRELGSSTTKRYPPITVWFASGNNLRYHGDMARRVMPIVLDPKMEAPETRSDFRHPDLLAWVKQARPRLAMAGLGILRAFLASGRPQSDLPVFGSYEAWSALVRQCVVWIGLPDPFIAQRQVLASADEGYEEKITLMRCWHACFGDQPRDLKTVLYQVKTHRAIDGMEPNKYDELFQAIMSLMPAWVKEPDTTHLGKYLQKIQREIREGFCFEKVSGDAKHAAKWRLTTLPQGE